MSLKLKSIGFVLAGLSFGALATMSMADELLKPGDRMAICGDSITEQKNHSVVIHHFESPGM